MNEKYSLDDLLSLISILSNDIANFKYVFEHCNIEKLSSLSTSFINFYISHIDGFISLTETLENLITNINERN